MKMKSRTKLLKQGNTRSRLKHKKIKLPQQYCPSENQGENRESEKTQQRKRKRVTWKEKRLKCIFEKWQF